MLNSSFIFVRIPASIEEPVEELTASKDGGLEHDELVKHAKEFFRVQAGADYLSCDIVAVSIPLPTNDYKAVSLYSNNYDNMEDLPENPRATDLVTACGHSLQKSMRGDVFVGRAHDNEAMEWERVDFLPSEADAKADWCFRTRSSGGGGGHGGNVSSLSNLVQKQLSVAAGQGKAPPQIVGGGADATNSAKLYGMDGAPAVAEVWGYWTQSAEEVELKLTVDAGTKAKDCKIIFKRQSLKISVLETVRLEGTLFGTIVPDDCTYTIENVNGGDGDVRELCITLTKAEEGSTWSWVSS